MLKPWHVCLTILLSICFYTLFCGQRNQRHAVTAIKIPRNKNDILTILKNENFHTYNCKEDIPPFIMQYLKLLSNDGFSIADPDEEYNCCCTTSPSLPARGLVFFAKSKDHFVIHYNKGAGIVNFDILLLLSIKNEQVTGIWQGSAGFGVTSVDDVIRYVETHPYVSDYIKENPSEI